MLNCLSFFIFPPFPLKWVRASARFGAFGRKPGRRRLAKCDAGSSRTGGFFPPRRDFSALGWRIAPAFFTLPARRRNVGFFCRAAHTLAGWAKSRTQRQHAAHSAVQALGTPAGSIGSIFPRWEDRHHRPFSGRSGVLRCSFETRLKCRFALEYQRFFGFGARSCSVSSPRFRQGRSFPTTLLQGR